MRKILMGLAFIIAVAGALFTNNKSYAVASPGVAEITLYRPISGCPSVKCTSTAITYACTDLKVNSDCSGIDYSGSFKRDTP